MCVCYVYVVHVFPEGMFCKPRLTFGLLCVEVRAVLVRVYILAPMTTTVFYFLQRVVEERIVCLGEVFSAALFG